MSGWKAKSEKKERWAGDCYNPRWRCLAGCYCYSLLNEVKRDIVGLLVLDTEGSGLKDVKHLLNDTYVPLLEKTRIKKLCL